MPVYAYKGFDLKGKAITGVRDADSARTLRVLLKKDGVLVNQITETVAEKQRKKALPFSQRQKSISSQDLAVATRQLSTLVGAAIPLVDALSALTDQVEHQGLRQILAQIKTRVNEGATLADAMSDHPKVFTSLFINMIRAGETSGALDVVLNRLADFTENQAKLRNKVVGALFYPIVMIGMAVIVVGIIMTVVIPKILKLFETQKMALPLPTQILIFVSNLVQNFWWAILILVAGSVWWFRRYRKTKEGREVTDRALLRMPLFGGIIRMLAVTRFSRTLSTLLASGVPLLTALDIVKNIVDNVVIQAALDMARSSIQEGESIAAPLRRSGEFPPIVTHMIAVGEKSGELEAMLGKIADAYDSQVEARVTALTSILEPLIIVVMGGVVAFIVFSIMLPMLQMSSFAK